MLLIPPLPSPILLYSFSPLQAICEVINDEKKRVLTRVAGGSHVEGKHEYVCNG